MCQHEIRVSAGVIVKKLNKINLMWYKKKKQDKFCRLKIILC